MLHLDNLFSFSPSGLTINSMYNTFFLINLFYINLKKYHRPGLEGVEAKPKKYLHMSVIISCGLYIFNPILKANFIYFLKILLLCMVSIQERFLIKSRLQWRAYGICSELQACPTNDVLEANWYTNSFFSKWLS